MDTRQRGARKPSGQPDLGLIGSLLAPGAGQPAAARDQDRGDQERGAVQAQRQVGADGGDQDAPDQLAQKRHRVVDGAERAVCGLEIVVRHQHRHGGRGQRPEHAHSDPAQCGQGDHRPRRRDQRQRCEHRGATDVADHQAAPHLQPIQPVSHQEPDHHHRRELGKQERGHPAR